MRRFLVAAMALLMVVLAQASGAQAQPALVFDMDSGRVLIAREAGRPWYPASLTKLMTAYLTFQAVARGRVRLDQVAVVSRHAAGGGGHGAAILGVKAGTQMTIHDMLAYLLVRSDADMAIALAEAVGGSEKDFVRMMNAAARKLGMTSTHFSNPHGMFSPDQITTARDMGMLALAIYQKFLKRNPALWRYFAAPYVLKGKRKQKNRNKLLFMMRGANGMKTGFLCKSGFNLVGTATRNGHTLAAVVLGRKTAYTRASYAKILLEEGFRMLAAGGFSAGRSIMNLPNTRQSPPSMSAQVCKGRSVRMAGLETPQGWAVAIGAYNASVNAEAALEAELVADGLWDKPLPRGVALMPQMRKFAGLIWRLDERTALALCARTKRHDLDCKVYPPQAFAQTAALIREKRALKLARAEARKARRTKRVVRRGNFSARRRKK